MNHRGMAMFVRQVKKKTFVLKITSRRFIEGQIFEKILEVKMLKDAETKYSQKFSFLLGSFLEKREHMPEGYFDDFAADLEDSKDLTSLVRTNQVEIKEIALRSQSNRQRNLQRRASGLGHNTKGIV